MGLKMMSLVFITYYNRADQSTYLVSCQMQNYQNHHDDNRELMAKRGSLRLHKYCIYPDHYTSLALVSLDIVKREKKEVGGERGGRGGKERE